MVSERRKLVIVGNGMAPGRALEKLFEAAPDAYTLLKNINYSTDDQISMIAAVELDGKSVDDAARTWLDANQATWQAWLP